MFWLIRVNQEPPFLDDSCMTGEGIHSVPVEVTSEQVRATLTALLALKSFEVARALGALAAHPAL